MEQIAIAGLDEKQLLGEHKAAILLRSIRDSTDTPGGDVSAIVKLTSQSVFEGAELARWVAALPPGCQIVIGSTVVDGGVIDWSRPSSWLFSPSRQFPKLSLPKLTIAPGPGGSPLISLETERGSCDLNGLDGGRFADCFSNLLRLSLVADALIQVSESVRSILEGSGGGSDALHVPSARASWELAGVSISYLAVLAALMQAMDNDPSSDRISQDVATAEMLSVRMLQEAREYGRAFSGSAARAVSGALNLEIDVEWAETCLMPAL